MTFHLTNTFLILTGKNASWTIHICSFCSKTGGLFQGVKLIYKVSRLNLSSSLDLRPHKFFIPNVLTMKRFKDLGDFGGSNQERK